MDSEEELLDMYLSGYIIRRWPAKKTEVTYYRIIDGFQPVGVHILTGESVVDDSWISALLRHVDLARDGDPLAFAAVMNSASELLREEVELPADLAILIADYLDGKIFRPSRKKPKNSGNLIRDGMIYGAIEALRNVHGLTYQSAYLRVADYLRKAKMKPNTAQSVKEIHLAQRRIFSKMQGSDKSQKN